MGKKGKPEEPVTTTKKKGGGWRAQLEEEEKQAKAEAERLFAIKNKIKFVRVRHILHEDEVVIKDAKEALKEKPTEDEFARVAEELS